MVAMVGEGDCYKDCYKDCYTPNQAFLWLRGGYARVNWMKS